MNNIIILILLPVLVIMSPPLGSQVQEIPVKKGPPVIFDKNPFSDLTIIHLLIRGGKKAEAPTESGLAYLTTRLSIEVYDKIMQQKMVEMGSRFDFQIENDYCLISITSLTPYLKDTLEIFIDMFTNPLFSSLRINRIKQHAIHLQKAEFDQDLNLIKLTLLNTFFKTPGNGTSIYGDEESIKRIGRTEIEGFFSNYFCRNNMCIAASSNLEKTEMAEILSTTISRIPLGERSIFNRQEVLKPEKNNFFFSKQRNQVMISFSFCTPELNPENFHKTFLLENLLGKGIGSALWRLREDERLAYLVYADTIQLKDAGILMAYLKTDHDKKQDARGKLNKTLRNLAEKDFSSEELENHKNHAQADFFRFNESGEKHALTLALFELLGPGYQYVEKLPAAIDRLSTEEFNAFKREVLKAEHMIQVIIGSENF